MHNQLIKARDGAQRGTKFLFLLACLFHLSPVCVCARAFMSYLNQIN